MPFCLSSQIQVSQFLFWPNVECLGDEQSSNCECIDYIKLHWPIFQTSTNKESTSTNRWQSHTKENSGPESMSPFQPEVVCTDAPKLENFLCEKFNV